MEHQGSSQALRPKGAGSVLVQSSVRVQGTTLQEGEMTRHLAHFDAFTVCCSFLKAMLCAQLCRLGLRLSIWLTLKLRKES